MLSKKGFQLTEVPTLVIVLITIALMLGISATILGNVRDGDSDTTTTTAFNANYTIDALNNATATSVVPTTLLNDALGKTHFVSGSCTGIKAVNVSDGEKMTSQLTISGCTITLKNVSFDDDKIRVNYTYTYNVYGNGYNVTQEGLDSTKDFSEWQGTFVVLIAAAVVIGLVGKYLFFG